MADFNARLYASQYPQDVVGMVLVDVSHPDLVPRWLALLPPESPDESQELGEFRQDLVSSEPEELESVDQETSAAQVRATGSLGSTPLVVLTAGGEEWKAWLPPEVAESIHQEWLQMQEELAALSSNGTHIVVEDCGHYIHGQQPDVVSDAIRSVVAQVRGE